MSLLVVLVLAAAAVGISPFAVRVLDRKAGWPLAALFVAAAWVLARDVTSFPSFQRTWVRDFVAGYGCGFFTPR